jgi:hypothetical protein
MKNDSMNLGRMSSQTALATRNKKVRGALKTNCFRFTALCLALVASTMFLAGNASAATPGAGMIYLPTGAPPSGGGLTSPISGTWVGLAPTSATPGRIWTSDHQQGFCRLEPIKNSNPPQWAVAGNPGDSKACFPASNAGVNTPGVPDFQIPAGSPQFGFAYVPFSAGITGVSRLTIDYLKQEITKTETLETAAALGAGNIGAKYTPIAVSLDSDGKLYVADNTGGVLVRITNPAGALGTQVIEQVGSNDHFGKFITGMAMKGTDWYSSAGSFLNRQFNATTCNGGCVATNLNINSQAVGNDPNSQFIYWDVFGILLNAEILFRYDTVSGALVEYSNGGYFDAGQTLFATYASIFGATLDPSGNIYVFDDTSGGILPDAARPIVPNAARIWMIPAGSPPFLNNSGPIAPPPVNTPPPPPPAGGQLYASVTRPKATLWIPSATPGTGHLWVSDASSGFCRVEVGLLPGLSNCFKPTAGFIPGQASYGNTVDALGNPVVNIYVPDTSSTVVYRETFAPATETLSASLGISVAPNKPTSTAVGLEGSVYMGFSNVSTINKITTPDTTPTLVTKVGSTFTGSGVKGMAFVGNNLFLVESTTVTELIAASPSLTVGKAILIGGPFTRKQTPPLNIASPLSISADQANKLLYIGNNGTLYTFSLSTFAQTVLATSGTLGDGTVVPFSSVTAVGFIPASITGTGAPFLFAGDDTASSPIGQGHIWKLQ